jgi:hypothetical protein
MKKTQILNCYSRCCTAVNSKSGIVAVRSSFLGLEVSKR